MKATTSLKTGDTATVIGNTSNTFFPIGETVRLDAKMDRGFMCWSLDGKKKFYVGFNDLEKTEL